MSDQQRAPEGKEELCPLCLTPGRVEGHTTKHFVSQYKELLREARSQAFEEAAEIMGKGPEWFDRYRELLAKVNEARATGAEKGKSDE